MRLPGTLRLGILALCLGVVVFGSAYFWVNSRTWVPVDLPVSLAPGHIRTGEFKINVESHFEILIKFPYNGGSACHDTDGLRTRQLTSISGRKITVPSTSPAASSGATQGAYLGSFVGKPGQYDLDIEVLSPTQSLDECQPRLQIESRWDDFNQWQSFLESSFWFCTFCVLVGVALLLAFASTRSRERYLKELRLRISNSDLRISSAPLVSLKNSRSFHLLLIIGILAVATGAGAFMATIHWYDSRKFVVVAMPVSLAPGHVKTGNFIVQLKGVYDISIDMGGHYFYDCAEYIVLKSRWIVTKDGRLVAHRERSGNYWEEPNAPIEGTNLGNFEAAPGNYNLDVEVLSDARCLNLGKPRLRIYLSDSDHFEYGELDLKLELFSLLSLCAGLLLLLAYYLTWKRRAQSPLPLAASLPKQEPSWGITVLRFRRVTPPSPWTMHPMRNTSTIALACSLTWFTVFVPMCFIYFGGRRVSQGIVVSLPRQGVATVAIASGLTAPLIRIDAKYHVFLNYKQTTWEELPAGLDHALHLLPVRVVYLDCDNDAPFMDAAQAIDISQGLGARVILMTPHSKSENRWDAKLK